MTQPTQAVLRALLQHPSDELYGLQISAQAGLPSGTIHPMLAKLEKIGWVESRWDDSDPHQTGRPRRRYYRLTREGAVRAQHALDRAAERVAALRQLRPGIAPGGLR